MSIRRYGLKSIRIRLILTSLIVGVIVLGIFVGSSMSLLARTFGEQTEARVAELDILLGKALLPELRDKNYKGLLTTIQALTGHNGLDYILIKDTKDQVLVQAGNVPQNVSLDQHLSAVDDGIYDNRKLITHGEDLLGIAEFGISTVPLEQLRYKLTGEATVLIIIGLLAMVAVVTLLSSFLLRSLTNLAECATKIAKGDLNVSFDAPTNDEVGETARAFNTMVQSLKQSRREQQNTLNALKDSEERYKNIMQTAVLGAYIMQDERFKYVNETMARALGYSEVDLIKRINPIDVVLPAYRSTFLGHTQQYLNGDVLPAYALKARHKDGHVLELLHWGRALVYRDKPAVMGTFVDITERNRALDTLRSSEEKFSAAFKASPDIVVFVRMSDGVILDSNDSLTEKLGWRRKEYMGKPAKTFINYWKEPSELRTLTRKINQNNRLNSHETVLYTKSGQPLPVLVSASIVDIDGEEIAVCTATDISELKQVESALQASEQNYKTIIDVTETGYAKIDENGRILEANREYARLAGFPTVADIIGHTPDEWVAPDFAKRNQMALRECFDKGRIRHLTQDYINPDGTAIPVEVNAARVVEDNSRRIIAIVRDVSERQLQEEEREEMQQQLRQSQKMDAIGKLTGGIAHDFNNILGSILGYTQLAQERFAPEGTGKLAEYLEQVRMAGERARDLIDQMLIFSRGGAVAPTPLQLAPLANDAVKLLKSTIPAGIELSYQYDQDLPAVMMDRSQLHQIILNACINARDAMAGGKGHIDIRLRQTVIESHTYTPCASCRQAVNGRFVELQIEDDGPGMNETVTGKIFDPFFTTKGVGEGTGMGLSVVHGIVHEHNGHILVHSDPGSGTLFRFLFPALETPAQIEPLADDVSIPQLGFGRVLVIDDELMFANYLAEMLSSKGYQVTVESDSYAAVNLFQSNPSAFDLVITDQAMPGLTGAEVAQAILAIRPMLPIVLCTGYKDKIDESFAKQLNFSGYLSKPVDQTELLRLMRTLLIVKSDNFQ